MIYDHETWEHHPSLEQLANTLASAANTTNLHFIRGVISFYLGIITSTYRVQVDLPTNRPVPLNIYGFYLSASGSGKGLITSTMEKLIQPFVKEYTSNYQAIKEQYIHNTATALATKFGTDINEEITKVTKDIDSFGQPLLWFSEGTSPAVKQMRSALVKIPYGSLNWIVDEVLSMPYGDDLFQDFIMAYDIGVLKQKLIKHTADSKRNVDPVNSQVFTNMLLFGTGSLLNDPTVYSVLTKQLESGLARRAIYAFSNTPNLVKTTAVERLAALKTNNTMNLTQAYQAHILGMSNQKWMNYTLTMSENLQLFYLGYQIHCEERALQFDNPILSIEMMHRHMKAIRLAGIYSVWDNQTTVSMKNFKAAIKVVEQSGLELQEMLKATPAHIKLAEYLAKKGEVTNSTLVTDLPWFGNKPKPVKNELLQLAIEYGHTNNIIISQSTRRGIDYIKGSTLQPTNLSKLVVSAGNHDAYNYQNHFIPWDNLHKLTSMQGVHWVSHHCNNGNRNENDVTEGFNLVVIDVDNKSENVSIEQAKTLLADYKFFIYETKSSTPERNRYRIIFPMTHTLYFNGDVFKEFMKNIYNWLPFESDEVTDQRSRKWLSYNGKYFYNEGTLLPALDFIPDTERQLKKAKVYADLNDLSSLHRWVITQANEQGRNNALIKFALLLLDAGIDVDRIEKEVLSLNTKLTSPLPETEVLSTVMVTVRKKDSQG